MRIILRKIPVLIFISALSPILSVAQTGGGREPRRELLLNQLEVLIWREPTAEKLSVDLRIHNGAAFDPQGKEGATCLLTQVMFPGTGVYEDFEESFGGSLNVSCEYDYVQIEATADPDKLVPVLEILATALQNPPIDRERTEVAKNARLAELKTGERDPKTMADLEIAERLYGDFPYGRPLMGSSESISRVDFADLIFVKQRILTSNNATLSISGNVRSAFAYRAARRIFGGWEKGDGRITANFSIPGAPDVTPLTVNTDFGTGVEERIAVETASRTSPDFHAAKLLYRVLRDRVREKELGTLDYNYYLLRGYYLLSVAEPKAGRDVESGRDGGSSDAIESSFKAVFAEPVTEAEFAKARAYVLAEFSGRGRHLNWFDVETYGLKSVKEEASLLAAVTAADVNRYASKAAKGNFVRVVVLPLEAEEPASEDDMEEPA